MRVVALTYGILRSDVSHCAMPTFSQGSHTCTRELFLGVVCTRLAKSLIHIVSHHCRCAGGHCGYARGPTAHRARVLRARLPMGLRGDGTDLAELCRYRNRMSAKGQ